MDCAVIYVHYSLSPEARYPVALEECYAVLAWATNPANSGLLRIDPTRVAVGGDSAGGNLAIAVSCKCYIYICMYSSKSFSLTLA